MLWTPTKGIIRVIHNIGIVGASGIGTAVPSNATTLLDGAVTELISAAANDQESWGIELFISGTGASATAAEACIDILIGGATDDVLIAALICGCAQARGPGWTYFFPLHIPQGKRIAAQMASVRTSITPQVACILYGGSPPPFRTGRKVTTYGTQINNARGVAVTPAFSGAAATVTQIVAATTEDHFCFMPGFQPGTQTAMNLGGMNIGIGVGAATEDRIGTWWAGKTTAEDVGGWWPRMPAFRDVPSGTRLTLMASTTGVSDGAYDGLIYAVS